MHKLNNLGYNPPTTKSHRNSKKYLKKLTRAQLDLSAEPLKKTQRGPSKSFITPAKIQPPPTLTASPKKLYLESCFTYNPKKLIKKRTKTNFINGDTNPIKSMHSQLHLTNYYKRTQKLVASKQRIMRINHERNKGVDFTSVIEADRMVKGIQPLTSRSRFKFKGNRSVVVVVGMSGERGEGVSGGGDLSGNNFGDGMPKTGQLKQNRSDLSVFNASHLTSSTKLPVTEKVNAKLTQGWSQTDMRKVTRNNLRNTRKYLKKRNSYSLPKLHIKSDLKNRMTLDQKWLKQFSSSRKGNLTTTRGGVFRVRRRPMNTYTGRSREVPGYFFGGSYSLLDKNEGSGSPRIITNETPDQISGHKIRFKDSEIFEISRLEDTTSQHLKTEETYPDEEDVVLEHEMTELQPAAEMTDPLEPQQTLREEEESLNRMVPLKLPFDLEDAQGHEDNDTKPPFETRLKMKLKQLKKMPLSPLIKNHLYYSSNPEDCAEFVRRLKMIRRAVTEPDEGETPKPQKIYPLFKKKKDSGPSSSRFILKKSRYEAFFEPKDALIDGTPFNDYYKHREDSESLESEFESTQSEEGTEETKDCNVMKEVYKKMKTAKSIKVKRLEVEEVPEKEKKAPKGKALRRRKKRGKYQYVEIYGDNKSSKVSSYRYRVDKPEKYKYKSYWYDSVCRMLAAKTLASDSAKPGYYRVLDQYGKNKLTVDGGGLSSRRRSSRKSRPSSKRYSRALMRQNSELISLERSQSHSRERLMKDLEFENDEEKERFKSASKFVENIELDLHFDKRKRVCCRALNVVRNIGGGAGHRPTF